MRVLGIDPGPTTHGAVLYDTVERRVVWSSKAATRTDLYELVDASGSAGLLAHTMTRREVLRHLGVLSGKGAPDSRVRAACIADHQTPGGMPAVGRKGSPGPLYGVSSHAWQALGLVLAFLNKGNQQ